MSTGDEGLSTQRRSKVFTWNPYLYDAWAEGGAVWLSGPTGGDDSDDGGNAGNDDPSQQIAELPARNVDVRRKITQI